LRTVIMGRSFAGWRCIPKEAIVRVAAFVAKLRL